MAKTNSNNRKAQKVMVFNTVDGHIDPETAWSFDSIHAAAKAIATEYGIELKAPEIYKYVMGMRKSDKAPKKLADLNLIIERVKVAEEAAEEATEEVAA